MDEVLDFIMIGVFHGNNDRVAFIGFHNNSIMMMQFFFNLEDKFSFNEIQYDVVVFLFSKLVI